MEPSPFRVRVGFLLRDSFFETTASGIPQEGGDGHVSIGTLSMKDWKRRAGSRRTWFEPWDIPTSNKGCRKLDACMDQGECSKTPSMSPQNKGRKGHSVASVIAITRQVRKAGKAIQQVKGGV